MADTGTATPGNPGIPGASLTSHSSLADQVASPVSGTNETTTQVENSAKISRPPSPAEEALDMDLGEPAFSILNTNSSSDTYGDVSGITTSTACDNNNMSLSEENKVNPMRPNCLPNISGDQPSVTVAAPLSITGSSTLSTSIISHNTQDNQRNTTMAGSNVNIETPILNLDLTSADVHMPQTSTPVNARTASTVDKHNEDEVQSDSSLHEDSNSSKLEESSASHQSTQTASGSMVIEDVVAPIIGYEVMEQRARFTVFKIQVQRSNSEKWFIFRRYTDFVILNDKLKDIYPFFRLALPPKKYLGDNFEKDFLQERIIGLQAFINNIIGHRDVCNSKLTRDFFCFDDPPGPHDSLEESRALCESLEEQLYNMKKELQERDARIELLEAELGIHKLEIENLRKSLRIERALNNKHNRISPASHSDTSLVEQDESSCTEADQAQSIENIKDGVISSDPPSALSSEQILDMNKEEHSAVMKLTKMLDDKVNRMVTADVHTGPELAT